MRKAAAFLTLDLLVLCVFASAGAYFAMFTLFEALWRRELKGSVYTVLCVRDADAPVEAMLRAAGAWTLAGGIVVADMSGGLPAAEKLVSDGLCLAVCPAGELAGRLDALSSERQRALENGP